MSRSPSRSRLLAVAALAVLAAALAATVLATTGSAARNVSAVKVVKNPKLGKHVLVTRRGFTLYSLSAETHGRFICTAKTCLSFWTPLVVPRGARPTGAAKLATIRRPDGRTQVTYRSLPLYSFSGDRKPGDTNGNGFKDVGTWRVATLTAAKAPPPPAPSPSSGGYGGYSS
jgi:predicted lipoprotein with Yx(FWY)xxD motif